MQLTLKQARRVEREIGKELEKETTASHRSHTVSVYEDLRGKIAAGQETAKADLNRVTNLVRIRFAIRKAIETQNEESGLNKLMNREAELKFLLQVLQNLTASELTEAELDIAAQRHAAAKTAMENGTPLQNRYGQPSDEVSVDAVLTAETVQSFREDARIIQRELVKVVESQAGINLNAKVLVSEDDAKFLEKAGIVL